MVIGLELGSRKNITLSEFSYSCRPQNLVINWQCRIFSNSLNFSLSENRIEELFFDQSQNNSYIGRGNVTGQKESFQSSLQQPLFLTFLSYYFLDYNPLSMQASNLKISTTFQQLSHSRYAKVNLLRFHKKASCYPKNGLIFDPLQRFFDDDFKTTKDKNLILSKLRIKRFNHPAKFLVWWFCDTEDFIT